MKPYIIKARYYETDQMGIIHHANYIRWMEEARIDLMLSPVLHAECEYKKSIRFDDEVKIVVSLQDIGRLKFTLKYEIYNISRGGVLSATGSTRHCFLNSKTGRPVMMDKEMKEFADVLRDLADKEQE